MRPEERNNLEKEEWRPIQGYDNRYEVSNKGRIKSLRYGRWGSSPRILKPAKIVNGNYRVVSLWEGGKSHCKYVHILVAEAFLPKPDGAWVVNHKDGDGSNNDTKNLEWVTFQQNILHSIYTLGKRNSPVMCIETGIIYPSISIAAIAVNCSPSDISDACITGKPFKGTHWVKISKKAYYSVKLKYERTRRIL